MFWIAYLLLSGCFKSEAVFHVSFIYYNCHPLHISLTATHIGVTYYSLYASRFNWLNGQINIFWHKEEKIKPYICIQIVFRYWGAANRAKPSYWFLPTARCYAPPKLSFAKPLTGQHFSTKSIFAIALLPNTKCSSPHLMSSLNHIKKHSPRNRIYGDSTYFVTKLL